MQYDISIRDMFPKFQTHFDQAQMTRMAMKKWILDCLPHQILQQMHTTDLSGKSDKDIMHIIARARRTPKR